MTDLILRPYKIVIENRADGFADYNFQFRSITISIGGKQLPAILMHNSGNQMELLKYISDITGHSNFLPNLRIKSEEEATLELNFLIGFIKQAFFKDGRFGYFPLAKFDMKFIYCDFLSSIFETGEEVLCKLYPKFICAEWFVPTDYVRTIVRLPFYNANRIKREDPSVFYYTLPLYNRMHACKTDFEIEDFELHLISESEKIMKQGRFKYALAKSINSPAKLYKMYLGEIYCLLISSEIIAKNKGKFTEFQNLRMEILRDFEHTVVFQSEQSENLDKIWKLCCSPNPDNHNVGYRLLALIQKGEL